MAWPCASRSTPSASSAASTPATWTSGPTTWPTPPPGSSGPPPRTGRSRSGWSATPPTSFPSCWRPGSGPTWSPTRPRPTTPSAGTSPRGSIPATPRRPGPRTRPATSSRPGSRWPPPARRGPGGRVRGRLRLPRVRARLHPAAVLPGQGAVPVGRPVRRPRRHRPHRPGRAGAVRRRRPPAPLAGHGRRAGPVPGAAGPDLLARLRRASPGRPGLQRPGRQAGGAGPDRDRPRPPGRRVGGQPLPGDRGHGRRQRPHRRLADPQRPAQHRLGRLLGERPPRRRGRHRPLHPRRGGGGGRRQRGGGPPGRAGPHQRPRHRGHAPRRRRLRPGPVGGGRAGHGPAGRGRPRGAVTAAPVPPGPPGPVDFLLFGIGQLVTCDPSLGEGPLGVVERAAVAAAGGRVVYAGPERSMPDLDMADDVDAFGADGQAVVPGFVDAHTHLVFAGDRADEFAARLRGVGYEEALAAGGGINRTVRDTRAASDKELEASAAGRLATALRYGTTTLEAKSGYGLTVEDERRSLEVLARVAARSPVELVPTFLGAHLIPEEL